MARQIDEFGDLVLLRRSARAQASRLGHVMGRYHVRPNDATKANSFCEKCGALLVVNSEPGEGLAERYGHALTMRCRGQRQ